MAYYDYKCDKCGDILEVEQSIFSEPIGILHCGQLRRRLIATNISTQFKGSGFYVNDSRSNSSGPNPL
jgi:putative FmdB family regulatory protein